MPHCFIFLIENKTSGNAERKLAIAGQQLCDRTDIVNKVKQLWEIYKFWCDPKDLKDFICQSNQYTCLWQIVGITFDIGNIVTYKRKRLSANNFNKKVYQSIKKLQTYVVILQLKQTENDQCSICKGKPLNQ